MPAAAESSWNSGKKKLYAGNNAEGALRYFDAVIAKAHDYYEGYYRGRACLALPKNPTNPQKFCKSSVRPQQIKPYPDALSFALAILLLGRTIPRMRTYPAQADSKFNPTPGPGTTNWENSELYRRSGTRSDAADLKRRNHWPRSTQGLRLFLIHSSARKITQSRPRPIRCYISRDPDSPEGQKQNRLRATPRSKLENSHP